MKNGSPPKKAAIFIQYELQLQKSKGRTHTIGEFDYT